MKRSLFVRVFSTAVVSCLPALVEGVPQAKPELAGHWVLNRQASELPAEIGFGADLVAAAGGETPGRGGRGRGSNPSSMPDTPSLFRRESQDDVQRLRQLTDEARNPSAFLAIDVAAAGVTVTDDRGRARTFRPTGKDEVLQLEQVPVSANVKWEAGRLTVLYKVEEGRELRYTYSLNPAQLVVQVQFVEKGGRDSARRIYDRAAPDAPWPPPPPAPTQAQAPQAGTATAALPPASHLPTERPPAEKPSEPAFNQSPNAELKGLTKLGIVVEGLGAQANACGLKQDAIEAAVSKRLTDAGFTVRRNADEDTYLYVNVMTSSLSNGVCVSHYDAFLYTHTTATLSYQTKPVLVQVSLLHKAGMSGGTPALHADSVMRDLGQYVDQFAARIRAANQ